MTSIKKWLTRGTGYGGTDSHFTTRAEARAKAKQIVDGKRKRVVIARFSEELYRGKRHTTRDCFVDYEVIRGHKGFPGVVTITPAKMAGWKE